MYGMLVRHRRRSTVIEAEGCAGSSLDVLADAIGVPDRLHPLSNLLGWDTVGRGRSMPATQGFGAKTPGDPISDSPFGHANNAPSFWRTSVTAGRGSVQIRSACRARQSRLLT